MKANDRVRPTTEMIGSFGHEIPHVPNVSPPFLAGCQSSTGIVALTWASGIEILVQSEVRVPAVVLSDRVGSSKRCVRQRRGPTRVSSPFLPNLPNCTALRQQVIARRSGPCTFGTWPSADRISSAYCDGARGHLHRLQDLIVDDRTGGSSGRLCVCGSRLVEWVKSDTWRMTKTVGLATFGDELAG